MSFRALTPDLYGKKSKNSDLPVFNKFTPKKHSDRVLIKRVLYTLVLLLVTYTIYSKVLIGDSRIPQSQNRQSPTSDNNHEVYKVTKDGVYKQEVTGGVVEEEELKEVTTEDLYKSNVDIFDLNEYEGSQEGAKNGDILLFLMPLRNAEHVLPMAFYNLMNLTYDHRLIDIAFLVSDCSPDDTTLETVFEYSVALQNGTLVDKLKHEEELKNSGNVRGTSDLYQSYMEPSYIESVRKAYSNPESHHPNYRTPFRSVTIFKKDFGQVIGQGFSDRHAVKVQGIRRKLMGRARNWLTSAALKPYHSWVYWRDADIETCPGDVIEELMLHNYDVMVPNVWRPLPTFLGNEQPYDLNSWVESDAGLELAKTLNEDDVIVEGYAEYPTWRAHLAYIRDANGDPREVIDLDGVGGVSILARAKIFRQGVHFPAFTFLNHAETEAFGKMAKKMGFRVGGLPHYTIWHIYEPSEDDLKEIARLERKKRRQKS